MEKEYNIVQLQKEFANLLATSYDNLPDDSDKEKVKIIINAFAVLLEKPTFYQRLYKETDGKFLFNFYVKGKPKDFAKKKEKSFNFFQYLYRTYCKFIGKQLFTVLVSFNNTIYDLFGMPMIEYDFKNKLVRNKINIELKEMIDSDRTLILLTTAGERQFAYQILSYYELSEKCEIFLYDVPNTKMICENDLGSTIEVSNVLFKLRKLDTHSELKSTYDYNHLITNSSKKLIYSLYPNGKGNYTYVALNEIYSLFCKLISIESKLKEKQINGKFIKFTRSDGVIEYRSRWIYTFNVNSDNVEIILGIHQTSVENGNSLFMGLIILKSNMSTLSLVDFIPYKDSRQLYMKTTLSKGSYIVIPVTTGFYITNFLDDEPSVNFPLIEERKKAEKTKTHLTSYSKIIIDEIFDKFDINKDGMISLEELKIFVDYALKDSEFSKPELADKLIKQMFLPMIDKDNQISNLAFRQFFFTMAGRSDNFVYQIFKKFGYDKIINPEVRHFFLSFNCNDSLDVKISDGLSNRLNSIANELYLKHMGIVKNYKHINLVYDIVGESNIILMLENITDSIKKVTLKMQKTGYFTMNTNEYQCQLEPREFRHLFAIATDKKTLKENILITFDITYE